MSRTTTLLKTVSALGVAGVLLTACGADGAAPPSGNGDNGSEAPVDDAFPVMQEWLGCDALDDLQPVQDYIGVEAVKAEGLQSDGLNEGLDAEALGCSGMFELATFEFEQGSVQTSTTGDAVIFAGVVPWENEDKAAENYKSRVGERRDNLPGFEYTDEQEGELGGSWDESVYLAADTDNRYHIDAYARYGQWIVFIGMDYLHDPGIRAYESAPEFYPDTTAEEMAVYPFTNEEVVDWIANDYMPQVQEAILEKIESEK